jgi:hypothetical protein
MTDARLILKSNLKSGRNGKRSVFDAILVIRCICSIENRDTTMATMAVTSSSSSASCGEFKDSVAPSDAAVPVKRHRASEGSRLPQPLASTTKRRRKSEGSLPNPQVCPSDSNTVAKTAVPARQNHQDEHAADSNVDFSNFKESKENREKELKKHCRHIQNVNNEQKALLHRLQRQVDMYKALTATSLSSSSSTEHGGLAWDCTVTNVAAGACTTFRLTSTRDADGNRLIKYTPVENTEILEPILHGVVEVDPEHLPAFLKDVLGSVFPEHSD